MSKILIDNYINTSLVEIVTNQIRSNIFSGKYPSGKKLIVRELSEELGVSHTPIKEALNRLVSEGYVEAQPRKSMVVKEYQNHNFIENMEIRLMCELFSVSEVISKAKLDMSFTAAMKEKLQQMKQMTESGMQNNEVWVECETEFHRAYMKMCGNDKLYSVYCSLESNRESYFAYLINREIPLEYSEKQLDYLEHKEILEAIEAFDERRLINAIVDHILRACREYALDDESKKKVMRLNRYTYFPHNLLGHKD